MTEKNIQEYTRRITKANRSQLIVIMYEMFDQYIQEAEGAAEALDYETMHKQIARGRKVLSQLMASLNMEYEISGRLLSIYRYVERQLIAGDLARKNEPLREGVRLMNKLAMAFREVAEQDSSLPLMQNTETVYAGMTYGRTDINESSLSEGSRGYFV